MPSRQDTERSRGPTRSLDASLPYSDPPLRGHDSYPAGLHSPLAEPLFKTFWVAGYEGGDHVNQQGRPLSINALTQHQTQAAADYRRADEFSMRTARESVGWRLSERSGRFDFSHVETRARAAAARDVQVVWTLLHYGWPRDLEILGDDFVPRFARYAGAAARYLGRFGKAAPVFIPIHEISYLAWALCEGGVMHGGRDLRGRTGEVKRQLVRAALAACDAIWQVTPCARIMHTDPLVHIVAPPGNPDAGAALQRERQFEALDMLGGHQAPELGGHPRYLDVVGLNYFPGNQWEALSAAPLDWYLRDPRRVDLADLLAEVHKRYRRPLVIAETGHTGVGRGAWIREVANQVRVALKSGIPVEGICLYAVLDRPDWNNPSHWHNHGLWDLQATADGTLDRRLNPSYARDLRLAQTQLGEQLGALHALRNSPLPARAELEPDMPDRETAHPLLPRTQDLRLSAA